MVSQRLTRQLIGIAFYACVLTLLVIGARATWHATEERWRGVVRGTPPALRPDDHASTPWGTTTALHTLPLDAIPAALDDLQQMGIGWIRQPMPWALVEPQPGVFNWEPWDTIVESAQARGLAVLFVLHEAPRWARPSAPDWPTAPPDEPAQFATFARTVAARYADAPVAFQIWDQPNVRPHWGDAFIDPTAYTHLLTTTAAAIRDANPFDTIVLAALAPNGEPGGYNMSEVRFLEGVYAANGANAFDVVALKAYGFWTGPEDRRVDESILNWSRMVLVRETMEAHGDTATPVWFVEGGWASLPDTWQGPPPPWGSDTPTVQSDRLRRAIARTRLEWPWVQRFGLFFYQPDAPPDDPVWGLALRSPTGAPTPFGLAWADVIAKNNHLTPGRWVPGRWPLPRPEANTLTFSARGSHLLGVWGSPPTQTLSIETDTIHASRTLDAGIHSLTRLDPDTPHTVRLSGGLPATLIVTYTPPVWRWWLATALAALLALGVGLRLTALLLALPWAHWQKRYHVLPERAQVAIFGLVLGAFWLLPAHPVLSAIGYAVVWLFVWARPDLALTATLLTLPFFLWGKAFGMLRFSIPELLTVAVGSVWLLQSVRRCAAQGKPWEEWLALLFRPRDALDWSVLAFVLLGTLSVAWAQNIGAATNEWRIVVVEPALFYWVVRRMGLSRKEIARLADALVLGGVLVALYALGQAVQGDVVAAEGVWRVRGPYGSPNNLSLYLGRVVVFVLGMLVVEYHHRRNEAGMLRQRRWWYAIALVPLVAALFLTFSRGAWLLGVPAALLFLAIASGRRARMVALVGIGVALLAILPFADTPRIRSAFDFSQGTWYMRRLLWRASLDMLRDYWLSGIGLDNFLYVYPDYRYKAAWREPNLSHPHNILLHWWLALGIMGVVVLVWQQIAFWRKAWHARRTVQPFEQALVWGCAAIMVDTLTHGLIDNSYFLVDLAFVWMWALAIVGWVSEQE